MSITEGLDYSMKLSPNFIELIYIIEWCDDNFGFNNWDWEPNDYVGYCTFYFRTEECRNWFLLRWS